jgi:uncharacterized oxidoreductase
MADLPSHIIAVADLTRVITDIFDKAGCDRAEAARIATHLISANLTGHDSHGVIRTPRYVSWLAEGKLVAGQTPEVITESATHAVLDGRYGFGQTIGEIATDLGISKAKAAGLSMIALRHAGHIGRIGGWAERAAAQGLISIHFVNVAQSVLVAPFGAVDRRFGTNPVCIGIPAAGDEPMLLLDFATSLVAEGKVLVASNGGKPIPEGSLVAPDGSLSTDPEVLYGPLTPTSPRNPANGPGALRAFGEHKGSGLAFMCDVLAGVLTGGGASGPLDPALDGRVSNGMLSIYIDAAHFGATHFAREAAAYAAWVREAAPAEHGADVLAPGDREARMRTERLRDGIPLQLDTWAAICAVAETLGVAIT